MVVTMSTDHGFVLTLYLGPTRAPNRPYHVHERQLRRLIKHTRDAKRLAAILSQEVDDALF